MSLINRFNNQGYQHQQAACLKLCRVAVLLLAVTTTSQVAADQVELSELGQLSLSYHQVTPQSHYTGAALTARVTNFVQSGYPVANMLEVSQQQWLVQQGQQVTHKQPVVQLSGDAVEHFLTEYKAQQQQLEVVAQRYQSNQQLFQKQAISAAQWQEISAAYHSTLLAFEHLDHFYQHIVQINKANNSITLAAPQAGHIDIVANQTILFSVSAAATSRLRGQLATFSKQPTSVSWQQCELAIDYVEQTSQGFTQTWWSIPLTDLPAHCQAPLGSQLSVTPHYQQTVFNVPASSIIRHQQQTYVWQLVQQALVLVPVDIIGKQAMNTANGAAYLQITSTQLAPNSQVLQQSVGAVYGHFIGLGGE